MDEQEFTKLSRRRDPHRPDSWLIMCGDIHAGTIAKSVGRPDAQNEWTWRAGFYPGSRAGEIKTGNAKSFDEAKAAFVKAWLAFASTRTPSDFTAYRDHVEWTARKYAARDQGQQVAIR